MANHPSAKKRARQNLIKKVRNSGRKTRIKTVVKSLYEAISSNDKTAAEKTLRTASSVLLKTVSKGTLHKKTASRKISRLSKKVSAMAS